MKYFNSVFFRCCHALIASVFIISTQVSADQIKIDNLIVQGEVGSPAGACIGNDCVNGESFASEMLKLKDINLRIRFLDNSSEDEEFNFSEPALPPLPYVAGDREAFNDAYDWSVDANQSHNGGDNAFYIQLRSRNFVNEADETKGSYPMLSDGTAPEWDCTTNPASTTGNFIAEDLPIIIKQLGNNQIIDGKITPTTHCSYLTSGEKTRISIQLASNNTGITLGEGSVITDGQISIGSTEKLRAIKHIARGLNDSDLLTLSSFNDYQFAMQRLNTIEQEITHLEVLAKENFGIAPETNIAVSPEKKKKSKGGSLEWFFIIALGFIVYHRKGKNFK